MTLRMMVITSRMSPRAIRLDVGRPTVASLNVVAIFEAIVWAWSNSGSGSRHCCR